MYTEHLLLHSSTLHLHSWSHHSYNGNVLDHSSQPGWKEESHCSQYTHQYKHPKEYPVNDHGCILPVLFHLVQKEKNTDEMDISVFTPHHLPFTSCQFPPPIDFSRLTEEFIMRLSLKCQSYFACLAYEKFKDKLHQVLMSQRYTFSG